MVQLAQFLQDLSSLELSGTVIGDSGSGEIPEEFRPKVLAAINAGLRLLYSKFHLKKSFLILRPLPFVVEYPIHSKYADSNESSPVNKLERYIEDTHLRPFKDDMVRITEVWSTSEWKFPLNDNSRPDGMFTPTPITLQLPVPMPEMRLLVQYQAFHPRVTDETVHLEIPETLEDALRAYVGYRVMSPIGTQEATAKANELMMLHSNIMTELERADALGQTFHTTYNKFNQRGFV